MVDVLRTMDPVELHWAHAVLEGAGVAAVILDQHVNAMEANMAIFARRLAVPAADEERARTLLREARQALDHGG